MAEEGAIAGSVADKECLGRGFSQVVADENEDIQVGGVCVSVCLCLSLPAFLLACLSTACVCPRLP